PGPERRQAGQGDPGRRAGHRDDQDRQQPAARHGADPAQPGLADQRPHGGEGGSLMIDIWLVVEWLVKSLVLIFVLLTGFAYTTFYERKLAALIQIRV